MVEKIIGKRQADDIFFSAFLTGLMTEKQADCVIRKMEKRSFDVMKFLGGLYKGTVGAAKSTISAIPPTIGWTAALGGATGVLGATAYDVLKERLSGEDPETKFSNEVEAMYANKKRELDDARWMDRVRGMRDELKRGYKKMTPKEYRKKYDELMEALDERA